MYKLEIKLKQHTPLIHFQHDQVGATLRASEVKPKLDRFVLTKLGREFYDKLSDDEFEKIGEDYDEKKNEEVLSFNDLPRRLQEFEIGKEIARKRGWLVGKGEHPALNYKMRIKAEDLITEQKMQIKDLHKKDKFKRPLFSTDNYPSQTNSLILSNIGGRPKEELLNFSISESIIITIFLFDEKLGQLIKSNVSTFFISNNFGNRTSKGFGSFEVKAINGIDISSNIPTDARVLSISFKKTYGRKRIIKNVFSLIHYLWKTLKSISGVDKKNLNNVLLNIQPQNTNDAKRIPSSIIFKPLININNHYYEVKILFLFNRDVIYRVTGDYKYSHYEDKLLDLKEYLENDNYRHLCSILGCNELEKKFKL